MSAGRIGAISFLNALPLTEPLARWRGGSVVWDPPSALAAALARRELDLALVPQVELAADPDYRAVPALGVASRGAAESILLFCDRPGEPVARIAVDRASRTSVELLRVLAHIDGWPPPEIRPAPADLTPVGIALAGFDALLLIGDRALAARRAPVGRTDLGSWWRARTGLPFVFAFWTGRAGTHPALIDAVQAAAREGLPRKDEIARAFAAAHLEVIDEAGAVRYLRETIHHEIGAAEEESVRRFAELRRAIGAPVPAGWRLRNFGDER